MIRQWAVPHGMYSKQTYKGVGVVGKVEANAVISLLHREDSNRASDLAVVHSGVTWKTVSWVVKQTTNERHTPMNSCLIIALMASSSVTCSKTPARPIFWL